MNYSHKFTTAWLAVLVIGITLAEDTETVLRVVPSNMAVEPGQDVVLACQHFPENQTEDTKLVWFMPSGEGPLSKLAVNQSYAEKNGSKFYRFQSENGTLTIKNATYDDAGTYTCKNENQKLEIQSIVKVYEMPSYITEIIVVLAINAILIVIFIACSIWTFFKDRKQANIENKRKHKLGHHEIAKKALTD